MFAVIKTGGKQHRVAVGDKLKVEKLAGEVGDQIDLTEVLLVGNDDGVQIGTPVLKGSAVSAKVIEQGRGKKIQVFKMKRRKNYRRTIGHRQSYTELEITGIA